jgi:hypothetical protein
MPNFLTSLIDPLADDRDRVASRYRFTGDWRSWAVPLALGGALLLVSLIGLAQDAYHFWYAYLVGWLFALSIPVGALFFVMFQHITKAKWVTVVRRFPEMLMSNFVLLAILGLPIFLFGMHDLYHWTHAELYDPADSHFDPIVAGKQAYFFWPAGAGGFPAFFYARLVLYFFVWIVVSHKLYTLSVRHDMDPSADTGRYLRRTSAWGIPAVGLVTSFFAFDVLMSLDPHWFSTIFGVYFFAGAFVAAIAAMTMMGLAFQKSGMLVGEATADHFHDLGKYLFAFTVFWTYIFFSQQMLIWYANIPEETVWFEHRWMHGWGTVYYALILFHFVLPFFLLIPRFTKRRAPLLAIMCGWLLVMHFVDLWWVAKPNLYVATGLDPQYAHAALTWMDLTMLIGFVGILAGATMWRSARHATAPYTDPYYPASLQFENV